VFGFKEIDAGDTFTHHHHRHAPERESGGVPLKGAASMVSGVEGAIALLARFTFDARLSARE
jgi:hypothetical protein